MDDCTRCMNYDDDGKPAECVCAQVFDPADDEHLCGFVPGNPLNRLFLRGA